MNDNRFKNVVEIDKFLESTMQKLKEEQIENLKGVKYLSNLIHNIHSR